MIEVSHLICQKTELDHQSIQLVCIITVTFKQVSAHSQLQFPLFSDGVSGGVVCYFLVFLPSTTSAASGLPYLVSASLGL